ncbi:zinc finger protein ZFP2-like isoform X2 [Wyeomyia smithii]|nr:zinc finger protein ZFP2-like isoform X2 [Wyeomyia smithii]
MFPLLSRINGVMLPEMVLVVMGVNINYRDGLPKMVCMNCLTKLDYAYNVREEFLASYKTLKSFAEQKKAGLVESLNNYQKEARVASETYAESILRQNRDVFTTRQSREQEYITDLSDDKRVEHLEESTVNEKLPTNLNLVPQESETDDTITKEISACGKDDQMQSSVRKKPRKRSNYELKDMEVKLDPNRCYICSKDFSSEEELKMHLSVHAYMIPYTCQQCAEKGGPSKTLTSLILLHRHFRMHASPIECPKCPWRVCTAVALYGHMQLYHRKDSRSEFTCNVCGVKLVNKCYFDRHMASHKAVEEGRYACSVCGHKFSTSTRLNRHMRSHTNEKPFDCQYCPKTFTTKTTLNIHERSHTGEKGFSCEFCGDTFRFRYHLKDHISALHPNSAPEQTKIEPNARSRNFFPHAIKCEFGCDFITDNKAKYYTHRAKHLPKFQCAHCPERFPTRQRLEHHQFLHTGVKQHCCDQCGKAFRYKNSLVEHLAAHNNDRPYACEVCGMAFVRERTLKEHRLKHSDKLNYSCRHCSKKFKYCADLSKHVRTHSEEMKATQEEVDQQLNNVLKKQSTDKM